MKLSWSRDYELGIGVIDNQHKRIVDYINDVDAMQSSGADRDHLQQVLHYLLDYTQSHFAFEEALLEQAGYRALAEHQLAHKTFIRQIEQLHKDFLEGKDVTGTLADILMNWLLEHIQSDDRSYSGLVKEKILAQSPHEHSSWIARASQRYFGSGRG